MYKVILLNDLQFFLIMEETLENVVNISTAGTHGDRIK